ncbi:MAG: hypothetical protein QXK13_07005 [Fervidicoccaceae archaeon]
MNEEKNRRIREKVKATRAKRKEQTAKVYEIKYALHAIPFSIGM